MATEPDINIGAIAEQLNGKVDTDVGNVNHDGSTVIANYAMPSTTFETVNFAASGEAYIAPADGYYCISRISDTANQYMSAVVEDPATNAVLYGDARITSAVSNYITMTIPIFKGGRLRLYYNLATADYFHFIYAKGSEPQS